ncbi:MAG: hypothetical protein ACRD08_17260, partial [Acidimicrobiales bacterium]
MSAHHQNGLLPRVLGGYGLSSAKTVAALGGGAHLRNLRRVAIGPYGIDEAVTLEALKPDRLLPALEALGGRG